MEQFEALVLALTLVKSGEVHIDYNHVCELADKYEILTTGKGIAKLLIQYNPREELELFKQRCRLTQSVTPAVASALLKPFQKVGKSERIRKDIKLKREGLRVLVEKMIISYYGSPRKKTRGLDYWLKTRFLELNATDPNAWSVEEWDSPADFSTPINPRPFEVSAREARNFSIINDEVKWLWVANDISFMTVQVASNNIKKPTVSKPKNGVRYTLYEMNNTIVVEQVDKKYLASIGWEPADNEGLVEIDGKHFIHRSFTPNLGYVPASRIGYIRDLETKGRTFVNLWHSALCYFMKMVKTVSELDLTMTLHVFPQKWQYVQKCPGPSRKQRCNMGRLTDQSECPSCKGSGFKIHNTAQDIVLLPMPESKEDMMDLDKMSAYKTPPIELIKFQNEYTLQLERQSHQAVFNSTVFIKVQSGAGGDGTAGSSTSNTATEADYNMASVYDTLEPYTEKYSETWKEKVTTFAMLAGERPENIDLLHLFPADPKLKTQTILLSERGQAKTSGAPAFLLEAIDDDIADVVYAGDPALMNEYIVKRRYWPFTGKTPEEIAISLQSEFVGKIFKVLYYNFDQIFQRLAMETVDFYLMTDLDKQRKLVYDMVESFIEEYLETEEPPALDRGITITDGEKEPDPSDNEE